jgi:hypothetical protein
VSITGAVLACDNRRTGGTIEELAGRLFVLAREEHPEVDQWEVERSHTCNGATDN